MQNFWAWEFELKEMNSEEPKDFGISPPSGLLSSLLCAHSALAQLAHFAIFALVGLAAVVALEHLRHLSSLRDVDISVLSDLFYVFPPRLSTVRADRAVLLAPPPLAARRQRPRPCCARRVDEAMQRVEAGMLPQLWPLAVPQSTITNVQVTQLQHTQLRILVQTLSVPFQPYSFHHFQSYQL